MVALLLLFKHSIRGTKYPYVPKIWDLMDQIKKRKVHNFLDAFSHLNKWVCPSVGLPIQKFKKRKRDRQTSKVTYRLECTRLSKWPKKYNLSPLVIQFCISAHHYVILRSLLMWKLYTLFSHYGCCFPSWVVVSHGWCPFFLCPRPPPPLKLWRFSIIGVMTLKGKYIGEWASLLPHSV